MSDLTPRERELVALGAAMGSNCVPCIEYHIPESRKAGLTDLEIHAAIQYADKVRQVPARKTLQAALKLLSSAADDVRTGGAGESCGCGANADDEKKEASKTAQPCSMMMRMPDAYREALILHDLEGLSAEQTAEICDCSVASAKIRIHRARSRLRQALKEQCEFYRDPDSVFRCDRKA